ncbi:MAG: hypothetical protein HQ488_00810 [Parcubacteria group bacterium]|nr:hypothetical protein [Parcubacteria group bacterium]
MVERREGSQVEELSPREKAAERAQKFELRSRAIFSALDVIKNRDPEHYPDDDSLDPDLYDSSDVKNAIAGVRTFIREFPREAFSDLEKFPIWLRHNVKCEAIGQLAVEDEEEAFRFYEEQTDVSGWTDQHTPEENMASALQWMARDIAPRMLLDDSEKGIDFLRRRVVSEESVAELGEGVAVARDAYSRRFLLLEKDPVKALDIMTRIDEMVGDHEDDHLIRDKQSFLERASEAFLNVDPETALQLHERFLASNYEKVNYRKHFRDQFANRVEVGRARKLVRDGDVVAAFESSKSMDVEEQHKGKQEKGLLMKELEEKVLALFEEYAAETLSDYDEKKIEVLDYKKAKDYIKSLPDDIPGFSKVCSRLSHSLFREAGSRAADYYSQLHPEVPTGLYNQEEFANMETTFRELLLVDVPELRWVNDNGVVEKTPEELLHFVKTMLSRTELRTGLLKQVELGKLPSNDEFRSSQEYNQIRQALFMVQKKDRKPLLTYAPGRSEDISFYRNFPGFGDLAEELEPDEREKLVAEVISQDHYAAIFATETGLKLTEAEQSKVLEKIGKDSLPFDLFFRADFKFYESESVDKDEFQKKLLLLNPEKFFSAFLANNGKEGSLELAESVSSLMMKTMIEVNPIKVIVFADSVGGFEKNFSDESVQLGYASTFKKPSDRQKSNIDRIREYTEVDPDWVSIGKLLTRDNPTLLELESYAGADGRLAEHIPWGGALKKLEVMQGHTANEAHDPWKTDLEPLVKTLKNEGLLSYESAEDGELLAKFVAEYGMINAQNLAEIFIGLSRGGGLADLSTEHQKILVEAMGVDQQLPSHKLLKRAFSRATKSGNVWTGGLKGVPEKAMDLIAPRETDGVKVGEEQFAPRGKVDFADLGEDDQDFVKEAYQFARADQLTPAQLLHELREVRRASIEGFLKDEVPGQLKTELGQEIFAAATGGGQFVATGQLGYVIGVWEKTRLEKPELAKLAGGYQEEVIEVAVRKRTEPGSEDKLDKEKRDIEKLIGKQLFKEAFSGMTESFQWDEGDQGFVDEPSGKLLLELGSASREQQSFLEDKMATLNAVVEEVASQMAELDGQNADEQRKGLEKKHNIVAGQVKGIEAKVKVLDAMNKGLDTLSEVIENQGASPDSIEIMENLAATGGKGEVFNRLMQRLSARHVRQIVDYDYGAELADRSLDPGVYVNKAANFIQQYLLEHYLHPEQADHQTGHEPFSKELIVALQKAWGVGKGAEKNAFVSTLMAMEKLSGPKSVSKTDTISVAMVPGQGLPRIMSGDTGDACTSSRHTELARGDYPGVKAFTYVLGRGTPQERFAGSALFVESKVQGTDDSALIVRANNPRENLIQSVDNVSFTLQSLEKAIETAKRRGIDEVLVPLDGVTQSSSNRSGVTEVYGNLFFQNPKRSLENTPDTNFNGYKVWDKHGGHGCVVVWTKKDGKINWPEPKPESKTEAEVEQKEEQG